MSKLLLSAVGLAALAMSSAIAQVNPPSTLTVTAVDNQTFDVNGLTLGYEATATFAGKPTIDP